jgi:LPXTG-motif cell wall-anchored protein
LTTAPTRTPTATVTPSLTPSPTSVITAIFGSQGKGSSWFAVFGLVILLGAGLVTWRSVRGKKG